MKSYEVRITGTAYADYTVQANSASEAEQKGRTAWAQRDVYEALGMVQSGEVILDDEGTMWDTEAASVTEVTA